MATASDKIEFIPDEPIDFVPEEVPASGGIDFIPDEVSPEVVQQEAQRNTLGAIQALDVMGAPQAFDWTDVAEQADRERFQAAEQARARALQAEEQGSGTGPGSEAFQWRRERDFQLGQISPNTSTGRMLAQQGQWELQQIEDVGTTEERERNPLPSQLLSSFMGPGLSATAQPVVESAARNIGPAIGGVLGAAALTPTPAGAGARAILPLVGGFLGAQTGGGAQETLLQATETPEETQARQQRAAEDAERNPGLTKIGALFAQRPFFRLGLAQFGRAAAGDRGALLNLGIAGTLGAGMEVASAMYRGENAKAEDIAAGIFSNLIMNEPTRLGRKLGFHPSTEEAAIEAAQKYAELPPEGPIPIGADLQSRLTTRGTTSMADVFAGVKPQTGEPNAQQISEAGTPDGGVRPPEVTPENVPLSTPEGGEGVQPSGQGEPLAEGTPEAPREVAAPVVEEVGRAVEPTKAEGPTGIRNAVVDENRRIAGLPPREQPLARSFPTIHEEARAVLAKDPEAGARLVSELSQEIRPLTDAEDAVLTFEQNTREHARTEAVDAINNAKTPEERDAAQQRLAEADNKLFEVYQVGQDAGTANARGLNARKLMQNRDFTLSKMRNEKQAIENGGEPLNEAQIKEVEAAHARIADLEKRLAESESKSAAFDAQNEYRRILRETSKEAKTAGKAKEAQVDFLARMRESAKARIAARRGRLNVTIDPLNIAGLADEAIVGATYVAEGVRDFAKWSAKMVSEFGDRVKPQLEALFQRAGTLAEDMGKAYAAGAPETPEAVAARIKPGDKLEQKTVHDIYRAHVNAGVEDFGEATKAVIADLQKTYPTITERQVHDALSNYGKISVPSKEADLVKLREFRNLARLMSQLEDAEKGVVPLKTGPQRDKSTAKVRELQKQVNDAMRRNGLRQLAPDRQLASGLEASKTRIRNQIEDLQLKIRRGDYEVPPKREPAIDREKIDLQYQLAKEKEKWQQGVIQDKWRKKPLGEKVLETAKGVAFDLTRGLMTTLDLPPIFRQGIFAIGRPIMVARAAGNAILSALSEKRAFKTMQDLRERPNAPLYEQSKLAIPKDGVQPLTRQEEMFMSHTLKNLPKWTLIGPALRFGDRGYNAFLGRIRADMFDAGVKAYGISATDSYSLKRLADIINTMTGRSNLPKRLETGAALANAVFFAPRMALARLKVSVGEPLWTGNAKTRMFALEQYARTLAGASLMYYLAKLGGHKVEEDLRSSDVGKIDMGNGTFLDPTGGLLGMTSFATRVITGEAKSNGGVIPLRENLRPLKTLDELFGTHMAARGKYDRQAAARLMGSFLRSKLAPVVGSAYNLYSGETFDRKKATLGGEAMNLITPISFRDVLETMERQGIEKGLALYTLSLFGMGLSNREKRRTR